MTLREKLQATADYHKDTVWSLYVHDLERILRETAADDAERDRYAAIGVLVVQLLALTTMDNDRSLMLAIGDGCVQVGYVEDVPLTSADTVVSAPILIDALESLKAKTEGETDV